MASQVLSGSSNVSYTNNTGQNVRIVINYMRSASTDVFNATITLNWSGVGVTAQLQAIGRNLAFSGTIGNNAIPIVSNSGPPITALPTELMIAPGQTFSASCGAYNIVVIPEGG